MKIDYKNTVEVELFEQREYGAGDNFEFTGNIDDAIKSFIKIRDRIPQEYLNTAYYRFSTYSEYDSNYVTLTVTYRRPKTKEDRDAEKEAQRLADENRLAWAKKNYEEALKRFEKENGK